MFKRIRELLKKIEKEKFTKRLDFLSLVPIFSNLKPHLLHNLAQACHEETFEVGQSIGNDTDNSFYVIREGKALMVRGQKNSLTIRRSEEFQTGDFFMRRRPRKDKKVSITASSNVKCLKIAADDIDLLVAPYINLEYSKSTNENESISNYDDSLSEKKLPKYFKNRVP